MRVYLSDAGYGYTHQGWLTGDQRYFLVDDELDEINYHHNTRTYVWDVSDLEAPVWHSPVDPADADRPLALPAALHASDISEFSLANGLQVVMASNFTQPLVDTPKSVVVIPKDRLDEVLEAGRARAAKEQQLFVELRAGKTTIELLGLDDSPVDRS